MAPPGRQKTRKTSRVFFAGWIAGINSFSDLRHSAVFTFNTWKFAGTVENKVLNSFVYLNFHSNKYFKNSLSKILVRRYSMK
jgi:hypothetical protein